MNAGFLERKSSCKFIVYKGIALFFFAGTLVKQAHSGKFNKLIRVGKKSTYFSKFSFIS
jgi:hypothetical protein